MTIATGVEIAHQKAPCTGCGQPTAVRVNGVVGHFACVEGGGDAGEIKNLVRAVRDRLGIELTDDQGAQVLIEWHAATDGLKFSSGWVGDVGINAYRWLRAKNGSDARGVGGAARLADGTLDGWSTDLVLHLDYLDEDQAPQIGQYVTEVDVNGQFLASAGIELGTADPVVIASPRSIAGYLGMPGYVRLGSTPRLGAGVNRALHGIQKGRTLAMTTARYLTRRGVDLDVSEALVWMDHRRHLALWYALFREARNRLSERPGQGAAIALKLVKVVVTTTLGGWLRSDKNQSLLMRRDWSDMIIAESWVRVLLSLDTAAARGRCPIGVRRDAAWFAGEEVPLCPDGMTFSTQLGKWKVARTVRVDEAVIAAHATKSPDMFVRALIAASAAHGTEGA